METVRNYTTCPIDYIQDVRFNPSTGDWDAAITILATDITVPLGSSRQAWTAQALCTDFIAVLRGTLPAHMRFTFAVQSLPPMAIGKVVQA